MQMAAQRSQMEAFATLGMVETMMLQREIPFLNLYVSRDNLVHDTLAQLHNVPFKEHFKKPFEGGIPRRTGRRCGRSKEGILFTFIKGIARPEIRNVQKLRRNSNNLV